MKLLTTCIFLITSLVMMNSSFAQDDNDLIAAIERQTAAIERQTAAIERQTLTIKVFYAINGYEKTDFRESIGDHYNFNNSIISGIENGALLGPDNPSDRTSIYYELGK